ncbi:heavy-metal-associated domain-containing protein [Aestuariivivens insulae]|uniref:heavy-metal-associated domain-containing protein n=1 Tax=Aestuariivivens insulae TaxID=1621988 RepID=UPI001F566491|nr:heavy metal-associated domain-containing protein [Aestuariivivens insulae]
MKLFKNIIVLMAITLFALNCKNSTNPEVKTIETAIANTSTNSATKTIDPNATYAKAEFTVEGMTCAIGCAATIEKKIAKMDGVSYAKVDFDKKLAMVEYDEAKVTPTLLEKTVTGVADTYKVSDMKTVDAFSTK